MGTTVLLSVELYLPYPASVTLIALKRYFMS